MSSFILVYSFRSGRSNSISFFYWFQGSFIFKVIKNLFKLFRPFLLIHGKLIWAFSLFLKPNLNVIFITFILLNDGLLKLSLYPKRIINSDKFGFCQMFDFKIFLNEKFFQLVAFILKLIYDPIFLIYYVFEFTYLLFHFL